jgi:hypothetical protein
MGTVVHDNSVQSDIGSSGEKMFQYAKIHFFTISSLLLFSKVVWSRVGAASDRTLSVIRNHPRTRQEPVRNQLGTIQEPIRNQSRTIKEPSRNQSGTIQDPSGTRESTTCVCRGGTFRPNVRPPPPNPTSTRTTFGRTAAAGGTRGLTQNWMHRF